MSGEVTAAIERLRKRYDDAAQLGSDMKPTSQQRRLYRAVFADLPAVLAAYEAAEHGASLEEVRADHHRNQHYSSSVAMAQAVLRADRAEAEVERLRADREALHTDEAWERACKAVSVRLFEGTEWLDLHQDDRRIISFYVGAVIDSLTADWEADQ